MISDDKAYRAALDQSQRVYEALQDLKQTVYPKNPKRFEVYAEGYIVELSRLRSEIDQYLNILPGKPGEHDLLLNLSGPRLFPDGVPLSTLAIAVNLRRGLQSIVERIVKRDPKGGGRKPAAIVDASDLLLTAMSFGSLRLAFDIPPETELFDSPSRKAIREGLSDLVSGIEWVSGDQKIPWLNDQIKDKSVRTTVLEQVLKLCPTLTGPVEKVVVGGKFAKGRDLQLRASGRKKLVSVLQKELPDEFVTEDGSLREIDLDALTFELRERPQSKPDLPCKFSEELYEIAKNALDKRIRVSGTLRLKKNGDPKELLVDEIDPQ